MNNLKYNISCHCHLFRFSQYSAAINTKYRKAFGKKWDVGTQNGLRTNDSFKIVGDKHEKLEETFSRSFF